MGRDPLRVISCQCLPQHSSINQKKNWGIPSKIRVAVVAQPVSTIPGSLTNYTFGNQGCSGCSTGFNRKKNWGIPSEIMVAVVAHPVSTILGSLPNYTFGNQGCSGCSTGFNRKKKIWGIPSEIR